MQRSSTDRNFLASVLYELQPFRFQDVITFADFIIVCSKQTAAAVYNLSIFTSKNVTFKTSFMSMLKLSLWVMGWMVTNYLDFGSMWIILSLFALLFLNLGQRKEGELSAYSVFNDGFQQLLGTMNAEQFDREIRNQGVADHNENELDDDWLDNNNDNKGHNNRHNTGKHGTARKKGKKARRTYEDRLKKKEAMAAFLEEAFQGGGANNDEEQWEAMPAHINEE